MKVISKETEFQEKLERGLKLSFKRPLAFKKEKNSVLVIMKDNKVVKIKPEDFQDVN